jgi:hypothetical protein
MSEQSQQDSTPDTSPAHAPTEAPQSSTAEILTPTEGVPPTFGQRLGRLLAHPKAPLVFVAAVVVCTACVIGPKIWPSVFRFPGSPAIVVFDPVKFVNAQRAAASILAAQPNADLSLTMTQVAKQAEAVILEEANGSVVLIRQAVVVPDGLRDITDDVLKRFGLPTNVPTVKNNAAEMTLENLAPTDSAFSPGALREDYRMELETRARDAAREQSKKTGQEALIP